MRSYEEGYLAFENGADYTENPYPYGSDEREDWDDGWDDAEMDQTSAENGEEEEY